MDDTSSFRASESREGEVAFRKKMTQIRHPGIGNNRTETASGSVKEPERLPTQPEGRLSLL
jgi:hypothetical protein